MRPHLDLEKCKTWGEIYWTCNRILFFFLSFHRFGKAISLFSQHFVAYAPKKLKITFCCKSLFLWQSSKHRGHYWMSTFLPCRYKLEMVL